MKRTLIPLAALLAAAPLGRIRGDELRQVTAVRSWSLTEATRVVIEVSGDFSFRSERAHNPERIFFDILRSRPHIEGRRFYAITVSDKLVKKVRVAEPTDGVTRVVLDLQGNADFSANQLSNPDRLIVELRAKGVAAPVPAAVPAPVVTQVLPAPPVLTAGPVGGSSLPYGRGAERSAAAPVGSAPLTSARGSEGSAALVTSSASLPYGRGSERSAAAPIGNVPLTNARSAEGSAAPVANSASLSYGRGPEAPARVVSESRASASESARAAKLASDGSGSLTRALGLKIRRVVLDPGHGGHDDGTSGPGGLLEKDLVLDVALRLGKLIESRMGSEVIYTRSDDTFIPLEGRTAIANERHADLFLSIHANSSPYKNIGGVESYYLNFTNAKDALAVASRENASSDKSVFELRDLIQKITLQDKAEESKEFAGRIQAALYPFAAHYDPGIKNRGIKKAPFVVLIGASMPSVLAEIGFLSNAKEEALLKKSEHRQRLAEALYHGVSRYAQSLSHFEVAQAADRVKN